MAKSPFDGMSDEDINRIFKAVMQNMPGMMARPQQASEEQRKQAAHNCAVTARELYDAYMEQGFNAYEALDLTKLILGKDVK